MEKEESVKVIPKMYLQFGQFLQTVIERSEKSIQTFYSYLYNVQYILAPYTCGVLTLTV